MNDPALNGSQPAFNEKWDAISKHEPPSASKSGLQASEIILQALKTKRRSQTAAWLNSLEKEANVSINTSAGDELTSFAFPSSTDNGPSIDNTAIGQAIRWLDRMFVEFELYASEFNLRAMGTNLVVSCTRPIKRTNVTDSINPQTIDDCLSYAGHIATQLWALVVRGCATKVEVYIIPSALLIAFSLNSTDESGYEPLLVIESAISKDNQIVWHVQDNIITTAQIPSLAKELFGDLIKVASGKMTEAEVIAQPLQTISSSENPTIVSSQPSPEAHPPIEQLINKAPTTMMPAKPNFAAPKAASTSLEKEIPPISMLQLESIKAASQLLYLTEKDIALLMELSKKALEAEDTPTFAQLKILTEKLDVLRHAISIVISNANQ